MGERIEKSQPENNKPQQVIEHIPPRQPIKNNEVVIFDTESENTLRNMKGNTGFFQLYEDLEHVWMWNGYPVKILGETEVQINDEKYKITPDIQNLLVDSSYMTAKSSNDMNKVVFGDTLQKTNYYNRTPTKRRISGRDKYIENILDDDVRSILILDTKVYGR